MRTRSESAEDRLGDFLRENLDAIVARWEQAVRELPSGRTLSESALRDHVPALLERIGAVLRSAREGGDQALGDLPELHGLYRLHQGFDLRAAAAELSTLRRVALELWREHAVRSDPGTVLDEVRGFDEAVDQVLALSVEGYAAAQNRTLASIDRVSAAGLGPGGLDAFLRRLLDVLLETTDVAAGASVFLKEEGDTLRIRAAAGVGADEVLGFSLRIGEGFTGRVAQERQPRLVRDATTDPTVLHNAFKAATIHALYGVPLLHDEGGGAELIGVACMGSVSAYDFPDEDKHLFMLMSQRAAAIIAQHQILAREREAQRSLQRTAAELSQVFALAPDMLAVVGADGHLKRINPAFIKLAGRSEAELQSTPYLDFVHPDDRARVAAEAARLFGGAPSVSLEFRTVRPSGQLRWIALNAAALPDADAAVAVGRDITPERERSLFEQQLIGIVSHDLRNPLHTISLSANALLLHADRLDPTSLKLVARAKSATDRAAALIRDLLDFTRARAAGGIPVSPEPVDLHVLAREVADELHSSFPDRELRFEQSGDGYGLWDRARIAQLLENLLSNACKYGAPDDPVVVRTQGGDRWVRLEVHNRGAPIDPSLLPHIFEPLRQAHRTGGIGAVRGVGLGLYIVDHIVRAHGGTIDVHSTAAEGTTFIVRLPREPPSLSP